MNAALRRHYDAIQQLAREEWPANDEQERATVPRDEAEAAR